MQGMIETVMPAIHRRGCRVRGSYHRNKHQSGEKQESFQRHARWGLKPMAGLALVWWICGFLGVGLDGRLHNR